MRYEGWNKKSIAGCLGLSERHVRRILDAFAQDGFAGLEDQRTRPVDHPANQLSLPLLHEVLDVQREYPRAGRFRIHGLLESRRRAERKAPAPSPGTIGRAMAINRERHGAPAAWPPPARSHTTADRTLLPYLPEYPHQYWFLDIRYLIRLNGSWTYSICVLEGYSRKILAGMACDCQDVVALLQLLCAVLTEYGHPFGIVSDNGGAFRAQDYRAFLEALNIVSCFIEKGQPWQNLIEANFLVEARLGDAKFERAQSLEELQAQHAAFIETFNTTRHWAHREREDGRRTPAEVLGWVRAQPVDPGDIRRHLRDMQCLRTVNRYGFVSVQRFYMYAERGLAKRRVAIWVYEGELRIEYQQTVLARYRAL